MAEEQLEMRKLAESIAKEISVMATESKWATRFVWAAIFQGALVSLLTLFLVLGEVGFLHPSVSLLINATVPGIWIALGYFAYLIVGVVGMAVTALFYQYLEVNLKSPYTGGAKSLAWLHLLLSNVGIVGASRPNHLYWVHNWCSHSSNGAGGTWNGDGGRRGNGI